MRVRCFAKLFLRERNEIFGFAFIFYQALSLLIRSGYTGISDQ